MAGIRYLKLAVAAGYRPAKAALEQLLKQMGEGPAAPAAVGAPRSREAASDSSDDGDDAADAVDETGIVDGEDLDAVD